MVDADSPASDPKNPSSAGAKSPVERPRRYRTGNTSPTLGDRRAYLGKIYELNRCPSRPSLTRGARTLSAPAPVTSVRSPALPLGTTRPIPSLIDQPLTRLDVSGDLRFEAGHQHPPRPLRHQIVEHSAQIVAVGDISDYLQHDAYSFPAGHTPAEPITKSGRVRRPSIRIPSSTTFGYSSGRYGRTASGQRSPTWF